jgi:hypothetical protein
METTRPAFFGVDRFGFRENVIDGIYAGLIGASVVGLFFLGVDGFTRTALFTPSLVGGVLFEGVTPRADLPVNLTWVALYSVVHGAAFVAFAFAVAFVTARMRKTPELLLLAIILFVLLELGFIAGTRLAVPGVAEVVGHGYIATANMLAAIAIATYLRVNQRG